MDKMRGRNGEEFFNIFERHINNTFVQNENAVTTRMFYNDSVFSNISNARGTQDASLAQRYNCRFTLVTGRH